MPGIVGLITKMPREWAEPQLLRMVKSICHESFYTTGVWIDESHGVYVGWAERRGSFSDGMPISNEKKDVHLIFSGEDFSQPDVRSQLKQKQHSLGPAASDYLVHLYEDDPNFLAELNGRFHGLLVDERGRFATLFNDRYGMNRLYYHESKEAFYFAAEAKAILSVRPELRRADTQGLAEFVACGCVLENRTLFEGIRILPPASAWVFRDGALERRGVYFESKEWEDQPTLSLEEYYRELFDVFRQIVPRYFDDTQRIAMSLTGGLDTRMILAWRKPDAGSLPCYSFGGMYRESQDVILARRIATACKQPFSVIPVSEDFLSQFQHYAERTVYLAEGSVDVSHSPDLYVNERAREVAPVRMTGNYGGEVLRRVRAFKPVSPTEGLFRSDFLAHVREAGNTYAAQTKTHPLSFAVFRQAPWHHYGLLALEQTQLTLRSPFLDNGFVKAVFRAPDSACVNNDICLRLIGDGDPSLLKIRTDRGDAGNNGFLAALFWRRLQEFTIKSEYAYDYGMPQWMSRFDHILSPLHPERLFLGRHKFKHFRVWYRDSLSKYVRETLLDPRTLHRPYLEKSGVENIVRGHLRGDRNYTSAIHKVLTLELVHRLFVDSH